jgi:hypothetical protein
MGSLFSLFISVCIAPNFQDCEVTLLPVSLCIPKFPRFMGSPLSPCASVFLLIIFRFLCGQLRIRGKRGISSSLNFL